METVLLRGCLLHEVEEAKSSCLGQSEVDSITVENSGMVVDQVLRLALKKMKRGKVARMNKICKNAKIW